MSESARVIPSFADSRGIPLRRQFDRPGAREWIRHGALFLTTFLTATFAGIYTAAPPREVPEPVLSGLLSYFLYIPQYYMASVLVYLSYAVDHPQILFEGITFAGALLTILLAHEMGHYLACLYYGVSATLPFFIPAPPLFLAGTFGAFIKMKSPIPSRRALFDIGLAGPLAGFIALLPVAVIGVFLAQPAPVIPDQQVIYFNDPLLLRIIAGFNGTNLRDAALNPFYLAAWIGLLVTSLNLMPVGQLDGGHGTFALFGQQAHRLIGRVAFVTMVVISVLGFIWHGSPSGFVYAVLLAVMLKVRHPAPERMEPLGTARTVTALITLIVFALSFWPFPLTLT